MTNSVSKLKAGVTALGLAAAFVTMTPARGAAGDNPYIGETMLVGFNFCPRNWAEANGAILPINNYQALFSLLGCSFGGDCRTSFALPDLRGRAPIGYGSGPGLATYLQGQRGGTERFTVTTQQLPSHNHMVNAVADGGDKGGPGNDFIAIVAPIPADPNATKYTAYHDGPPDKQMDPGMISNTGGNQPVTHRGPYLAMKWCIALNGVFPSRN
ncbi:phage tail protein [Marimonas arenosa]|uniref:Tail fiber protein n=1 Tax=Marimonas arenosa TaxID=1795305 RepID=A0AAE4B4Q2_9RHOB|nr:tail fiber protein [Marimonas arenosa]MDQ2088326.1 tail fiber protein [Marimonas arenosa]